MWSLHKSYKNRHLNGRKLMNEIQTKSVGTAKNAPPGISAQSDSETPRPISIDRKKDQENNFKDSDGPKEQPRQKRIPSGGKMQKPTHAQGRQEPKKCKIHPQGRGTDKAHPKSSDPASSAPSLPSPAMQYPLSGSCAFRASTHPL